MIQREIIKMPGHEPIDPNENNLFLFLRERYYVAMWFVPLPNALGRFGKGGNINAMMWRDKEVPDRWCLQFRFRHYKDEKNFDSSDERSWFSAEDQGSEQEIRSKFERWLNISSKSSVIFGEKPLTIHTYELNCDGDQAQRMLVENPPFWMHSQAQLAE